MTNDIVKKAWKLIEEIEAMGGMTEANNAGIPKMRIEQAAARKQARIDSKQDVIIGVNQYILDEEDDLQILEVDNKAVREQQLERLKSVRSIETRMRFVKVWRILPKRRKLMIKIY